MKGSNLKQLNQALCSLLLFVSAFSIAQSSDKGMSLPTGIERWGSIPIGSEKTVFVIPDGFPMTASWDSKRPEMYQAGFFPEGQSREAWKDSLRLMAFGIPKGDEAPAKKMLGIVASQIKSICPNDFFLENKEQTDSLRAAAILGCRKLGGDPTKSIAGYFLAIQGKETVFVFAREKRQDTAIVDTPVSKDIQSKWQAETDRAVICGRNEPCIGKPNR